MPQVSLNDWFAEETIDLIARMIKRRSGNKPLTVLDLFNTLKEETDALHPETIEFIKDYLEKVHSQSESETETVRESNNDALFSPELQKVISDTHTLVQQTIGNPKIERKHFWVPLLQWLKMRMTPDYDSYGRLSSIESLLFNKEYETKIQNQTEQVKGEVKTGLLQPDGKINFSRRLIKTLQLAKFRASEKESASVTTNHLLYALIVTHLNSDLEFMRDLNVAEIVTFLDKIKTPRKSKKSGKNMLRSVLELTIEKAKYSPYSYVDFQHLGLALLDYEDPVIEAFLVKTALNKEILRRTFDHCLSSNTRSQPKFEPVDVKDFY